MSHVKLDQLRSSVGTHRKDLTKLLNRVHEQYTPSLTVEQKAVLLDQLMHVKSDIDKEHTNANLSRDQGHSSLVQKGKA